MGLKALKERPDVCFVQQLTQGTVTMPLPERAFHLPRFLQPAPNHLTLCMCVKSSLTGLIKNEKNQK